MRVEESLKRLGLTVPNLEALWRVNASGAHYISHFPVKGLLYLCGTTPVRDGRGYLPGVVGKDLEIAQGYEAARCSWSSMASAASPRAPPSAARGWAGAPAWK